MTNKIVEVSRNGKTEKVDFNHFMNHEMLIKPDVAGIVDALASGETIVLNGGTANQVIYSTTDTNEFFLQMNRDFGIKVVR